MQRAEQLIKLISEISSIHQIRKPKILHTNQPHVLR